jgi:uncharacterized protein YraI
VAIAAALSAGVVTPMSNAQATDYVRYYTTAGVNLRSGPGTNYSVVQFVGANTPVDVTCQATGTSINGNSLWDHLTGGQWVADYYTTSPNFNALSPPYRWC